MSTARINGPAGTPAGFEVVGESARFLAITSGDRAGQLVAQRHGVRLAGG